MADGPYKSMGRDPDSDRPKRTKDKSFKCPKCGARVFTSDWPFCSGNRIEHLRG